MAPLHIFERTGIELEYMLVDRDSLEVRPEVDGWFTRAAGGPVSEFADNGMTWSNELVRHVAELKVTEPVPDLDSLGRRFADAIRRQTPHLEAMNACLLPGAMHPWMNPKQQTMLWPHEYRDIYQTYDRIFDCHRHGWANLQSMHINIPFHGDAEFGRLHAAIRLLLPILPAVAASSPYTDGAWTGNLDNRLAVYVGNAAMIPSIAGSIIPEPVYSEDAYDQVIFQPMYKAIAPHDPEGILGEPFLNSRGAIARFDRGSIEIRLIDVQEYPDADLAIAQAVLHVLETWVQDGTADVERGGTCPTAWLREQLDACMVDAEQAVIDPRLSPWYRLPGDAKATAADAWRALTDGWQPDDQGQANAWHTILDEGPLARRMLKSTGRQPSRHDLHNLMRSLADCLAGHRGDHP